MKTNAYLIEYATAQIGRPYWFGTFGNTANAALYKAKKAQYPKYYTAKNYPSQYGQRVHDCAGLIKGALWSATPNSTPKYNAKQDYGATGFYNAAKKKGKISTFDKVNGRLVFKGNEKTKTHVGVYVDGYVIEAKGHAYGVVKTKFNAASWPYWAQCHLFSAETAQNNAGNNQAGNNTENGANASQGQTGAKKSIDELAQEVLAGKWGVGSDRKTRLTKAGYDYNKVQNRVNEILYGKKVYLTVNTIKDPLNMRTTPNGAIIGSVPKGKQVELIQKTNADWYKVKYNGKTGYCYAKLLKA